MRAAIYARVSTKTGSQNPDMQIGELRDYCQRRGSDIAGEFTDVGVTGSKEQQPQLDRLLVECRKRRLDAVVVYPYDRFARSLRQLDAGEDGEHKPTVKNSAQSASSLFPCMRAWTPRRRTAEFERELILERVRSGLAAARARGKRIGRPRKTVDADKIERLRVSGASWRTIAKRLGVSVGAAHSVAQSRSKNASRENSVSS